MSDPICKRCGMKEVQHIHLRYPRSSIGARLCPGFKTFEAKPEPKPDANGWFRGDQAEPEEGRWYLTRIQKSKDSGHYTVTRRSDANWSDLFEPESEIYWKYIDPPEDVE